MQFQPPPELMDNVGPLVMCYGIGIAVLTVLVHLFFAIGVASDDVDGKLVPKFVWVLATLLTGPVAGALFWIIHHGVPAIGHAPSESGGTPAPSTPVGNPSGYHSDPPPRRPVE